MRTVHLHVWHVLGEDEPDVHLPYLFIIYVLFIYYVFIIYLFIINYYLLFIIIELF